MKNLNVNCYICVQKQKKNLSKKYFTQQNCNMNIQSRAEAKLPRVLQIKSGRKKA